MSLWHEERSERFRDWKLEYSWTWAAQATSKRRTGFRNFYMFSTGYLWYPFIDCELYLPGKKLFSCPHCSYKAMKQIHVTRHIKTRHSHDGEFSLILPLFPCTSTLLSLHPSLSLLSLYPLPLSFSWTPSLSPFFTALSLSFLHSPASLLSSHPGLSPFLLSLPSLPWVVFTVCGGKTNSFVMRRTCVG